MFTWFKKSKTKHSAPKTDHPDDPDISSVAPNERNPEPDLESEMEEEPAVHPRPYWNSGTSVHDLIGQIYQEHLKKGTFDDLPGKGKPFEVPSGDIMNSILSHNHVLPDWLTLQHEIRDRVHLLLSFSHHEDKSKIELELNEINQKIAKYNNMVPSSILQKSKLTQDNLEQQYRHWI